LLTISKTISKTLFKTLSETWVMAISCIWCRDSRPPLFPRDFAELGKWLRWRPN
jgi:hypothetical protein